MSTTASRTPPHLVPENLVGKRFPRDTFGECKISVIGYCPPARVLDKYGPVATSDQYFIHVSPHSVKRCTFGVLEFLSLEHVYGGPVSSSTVEELAYYGIDYILAYGLAGGLGTQGLAMGDFYLIDEAWVADGTTPHYTGESTVSCDAGLREMIMELPKPSGLDKITQVRAFTGDAIYREDQVYPDTARARGCDIVNPGTSHLYAASVTSNERRGIKSIECGVISDVTGGSDAEWESGLSEMLSSESSDLSPLALTGRIVEFYVETLAPLLLADGDDQKMGVG